MTRIFIGFIGIVFLVISCAKKNDQGEAPQTLATAAQAETPSEYVKGESLYHHFCELCHGQRGLGTDKGPPFISAIYHPNHHGDEAFVLAARNGSRAHHWNFGDMPPIPDIKEDEVRQVVGYIRWLQRINKIY